ncbi:hypothetical protein XENORESO_016080 [Xenotaenia resolanae]|uniref:Uncharacterized protein n=1 Tax=Xenotaenia resolanae TaxID=208358 RepID=A0ABV0VVL3_9TELE
MNSNNIVSGSGMSAYTRDRFSCRIIGSCGTALARRLTVQNQSLCAGFTDSVQVFWSSSFCFLLSVHSSVILPDSLSRQFILPCSEGVCWLGEAGAWSLLPGCAAKGAPLLSGILRINSSLAKFIDPMSQDSGGLQWYQSGQT